MKHRSFVFHIVSLNLKAICDSKIIQILNETNIRFLMIITWVIVKNALMVLACTFYHKTTRL